ncbi:MAG: hypothetical protein U0556_09860 [Dehalococcoidia bacterium]
MAIWTNRLLRYVPPTQVLHPAAAGVNLTLSGTLVAQVATLRHPAGQPLLDLDATTPANYATVAYRKNNLLRWTVAATNETESGSNAGSNFEIKRYDDSGAIIDMPIRVGRKRGDVSFDAQPMIVLKRSSLTLSGGTSISWNNFSYLTDNTAGNAWIAVNGSTPWTTFKVPVAGVYLAICTVKLTAPSSTVFRDNDGWQLDILSPNPQGGSWEGANTTGYLMVGAGYTVPTADGTYNGTYRGSLTGWATGTLGANGELRVDLSELVAAMPDVTYTALLAIYKVA